MPALVLDSSRSPFARFRPLPLGAVTLRDRIWAPRRKMNRAVTLASQFRRCEETGRIDNFRRAAGQPGYAEKPFQGRYYNDSDLYKWVEAVAYTLAEGPDVQLEQMLKTAVDVISAAQHPDGYLNTYFSRDREGERWSNLRDWHELYCAGHLFQAAVAVARCTGRQELLSVARRYADLICQVFGPEGRNGTCGHQEIELALVELYRHTGEARYLEQARLFLERRGQVPPILGGREYHQDHQPFRQLEAVTGHAVRMMYYTSGAADVVLETGDGEYRAALERLWVNMVTRRMYVTGGVGSRHDGEAFGGDWELPNERAYAETCAAIGSVMWQWRMLLLTGEARFADLMELTLFNAVACGLSLDGERYFYENPLADDGEHRRQPWFDCACCPPNLARLLASLPAYFYGVKDEALWIHLYGRSTAEAELASGNKVRLTQRTEYPWNGEIEIQVDPEMTGEFTLHLRIPGWCSSLETWITVNGEPTGGNQPLLAGSYLELQRVWSPGDIVRLNLPMPVQRVRCHPYVAGNEDRVALQRGPLLYCIEQTDMGVDPRDVVLPAESDLTAVWQLDLLGGAVALRGTALVRDVRSAWKGALYKQAADTWSPEVEPVELVAVPYFTWANREPGGMAVWIRSR